MLAEQDGGCLFSISVRQRRDQSHFLGSSNSFLHVLDLAVGFADAVGPIHPIAVGFSR